MIKIIIVTKILIIITTTILKQKPPHISSMTHTRELDRFSISNMENSIRKQRVL